MCLTIASKHTLRNKKKLYFFLSFFHTFQLLNDLRICNVETFGQNTRHIMSTKIKLFTILKGKICFFRFEILIAYMYIQYY